MSAPNKQYDPVEVAVLSPDEVAGMRDAALAAIAAAGSLNELKAARLVGLASSSSDNGWLGAEGAGAAAVTTWSSGRPLRAR